MGSTRNAQVFGVMARARASRSPKGTLTNPGVNGPKLRRYPSSDENPTMVVVRPQVQAVLDKLKGVPVDIEPRFTAVK